MSKVKNAYKEIEDIIGPDFVSDKDFMKASVDPNFLLSPNKFHMYSYDCTKHIVKDEE